MRGDACTPACGYCGACTPEWDRDESEDRPVFCGQCGKDISGPYDYKLSVAFGTFCSQACADAYELKFQARTPRRRSA